MPQEATARRLGDTVYIRMKVPAKNTTGRGSFSVDRLEVYGATVAPAAGLPKNTDLVKPSELISKIAVKPPPDPDAAEDEGEPKDVRPSPGDVVTFAEKITNAQLVPHNFPAPKGAKTPGSKQAKNRPSPGTTPPGISPSGATPAVPAPAVLTRSYVIRGMAKNGNKGTPTARIDVPLLTPPGRAQRGPSPSWDESSVTIGWNPPVAATDEAPGVQYNVYSVPPGNPEPANAPTALPVPLNPKPLDETSFTHQGAEPDKEQCFVVRSVATVGTSTIESDPSDPICVTPKDTFPPAPPKGLIAVGDIGAVNLVWDANTESDLAGYIVLRGEAPGDNMQPLMKDTIKENRYVDRTAAAGVAYVYTVIAVDKAGNRSTPSNRVQEAAR